MGNCALVDELNRLRKSSGDSIDSEKSFDEFKQYMHVARDIEKDLKNILRNVNRSHRKTLVLLCGSAGDGKSHMLSFLRNYDNEQLLDNYRIHNDATESSAPNKTAVDTLNQVLDDFSDNRIHQPGTNLILAINLGVLNNFIESPKYGKHFTTLRKYVEDHSILSTKVVDNEYNPLSSFQHVSFADYQLYTVTEKGAESKYIETLLQRVFSPLDNNPFYAAYCRGCKECSRQIWCPVRYNFLFLQKDEVQKCITKLLIMTIIKRKEILTTREILNFFYDISVLQDFDVSELDNVIDDDSKLLKLFLRGMTPSLLFDQPGLSMLMNHIGENDPLLYRDEKGDDFAVEYYVSSDASQFVKKEVNDTPYKDLLLDSKMLEEINSDKEIKGTVFTCLVRLNALKEDTLQDSIYNEFVKMLYYFNSGRKKQVNNLYNLAKHAILQWCGTDDSGHVCIGKNKNYLLYEEIDFKPNSDCIPAESKDAELHRFLPELKVSYKNDKDKSAQPFDLDIDFSLYQMIIRLNHGYVHTSDDESNFTDFISFIKRLLQTGNSDREIFIVDHKGRKSLFRRTDLGYEFEVKK